MCNRTKLDYMILRTYQADKESKFYSNEGALTINRMNG